MSHTLAPAGPPTKEDLQLGGSSQPPATGRKGLVGLSLHALMLIAALVGIAYTNAGFAHFKFVWIVLAPFYGVICISDGLGGARSGRERVRLVITQVLHWLAFLAVMYLMFLPRVEGIMNEDAAAVALLVILALGTFVAGVHAWSWRVCVVGIFLATAVPAMAWIDETGLLLMVAGVAIAVLIIASFFAYRWELRRWRA